MHTLFNKRELVNSVFFVIRFAVKKLDIYHVFIHFLPFPWSSLLDKMMKYQNFNDVSIIIENKTSSSFVWSAPMTTEIHVQYSENMQRVN